MAEGTFSESWYRIAGQRICLRPGIKVRRQNFRGERWFVLEDPFSNQFFRLRPAGYEFVARLRRDRTVQEAWQECVDRFPDDAPGQEAVIQLLSQLYHANLLQYDLATDSAQLFERYRKRRQREIGFGFLNVMFMRFPLLDPDRFLVRTLPVMGRLISLPGLILWLVVVGAGLKTVADNWPALWEQTQSVLAPGNLFLLYVGLVLVKGLHEFGHAYFCRKFGGEVHVMGIMLMVFTPIPYVDATSSWSFRSKWKRILVGAAGVIVELFVAAVAVMIWARTGPGTLHSLTYNLMFVASVSTLIFNINPLLRFDGYYILSDVVEIPNLHQQALMQLRFLFERYLFGVKKAESPAETRRKGVWLTVFGVASLVYRVVVFSGILLFVADRFLIIGLVMAAVCLISWVTVPVFKFVNYLASSPQLDRVRRRAIGVTAGLLLALIVLLQVVPFPRHFRAPGVVRASERTQIVAGTAGHLAEVIAKPGSHVVRGQPLLRMTNHELELELAGTRQRAAEVKARLLRAMEKESADVAPLAGVQKAVRARLAKLEADAANLLIPARHDGIWVAPGIEDHVGQWLPRGAGLGLLINPGGFEFAVTVRQDDANALFDQGIRGAGVRLFGDAGTELPVRDLRIVPGEQRQLPSAALGWLRGGEVAVAVDDKQGTTAAQPFFEVIAQFGKTGDVVLLDGSSGRIRFDLPAEPLLPRWLRRLRQLLQKRYRI